MIQKTPEKVPQSSISCNGVAMVETKTPTKELTITNEDENPHFVYDYYYVNKKQLDFRALENILAIEACSDTLLESYRDDETGNYDDDDDDSNDEANWRNDYPDSDPDDFDYSPRRDSYDGGLYIF